MTALATILGLLPLALGFGEGNETMVPLARAVVGGLAVSTVMTLLVVPVSTVSCWPVGPLSSHDGRHAAEDLPMPDARRSITTPPRNLRRLFLLAERSLIDRDPSDLASLCFSIASGSLQRTLSALFQQLHADPCSTPFTRHDRSMFKP